MEKNRNIHSKQTNKTAEDIDMHPKQEETKPMAGHKKRKKEMGKKQKD
jgi:hypothetical protein